MRRQGEGEREGGGCEGTREMTYLCMSTRVYRKPWWWRKMGVLFQRHRFVEMVLREGGREREREGRGGREGGEGGRRGREGREKGRMRDQKEGGDGETCFLLDWHPRTFVGLTMAAVPHRNQTARDEVSGSSYRRWCSGRMFGSAIWYLPLADCQVLAEGVWPGGRRARGERNSLTTACKHEATMLLKLKREAVDQVYSCCGQDLGTDVLLHKAC